MKILGTLLVAILAGACGEFGGSNRQGFEKTLAYIRQNGLPKLSQLIPALPPQFASADGVSVDETGKPLIPNGSGSLGFSADLDGLADEARSLSVQGFSEARRIEAAIQNFARPIYGVLGQAELFTELAGIGAADAQGLIDAGKASSLESVGQIFDQLLDKPMFAISTGGQAGMPSYLMLGTSLDGRSVEMSGLFEGVKNTFKTGFKASINFDELTGLKVELSFLPALLSGLIADWKLSICPEDVWKIMAFTPDGNSGEGLASLSVTSQECPEQRNAVSTLSFGQSEKGTWQFGAAFAQNFADASADSLRGWLGERQGFVLQAVASSELDKLSAAAAVLKESDFSNVDQERVDGFGVGRLLADFFTAKYWQPKRQSAKSGSVFTNYNNVSYWACDAAIISSAIQGEVETAEDLCASRPIDVEDGLSFLKSVKKNLRQTSLAPAELTSTVSSLIDVLTVRNSIFLGNDQLAYKAAPDDTYSALDDERKASAPVITEISSTSWVSSAVAELPEIAAEDVPDTAYKAITGPLKKFIDSECQELSADSAEKAKKDPTAAKARCG